MNISKKFKIELRVGTFIVIDVDGNGSPEIWFRTQSLQIWLHDPTYCRRTEISSETEIKGKSS
jgi:hypothetical protein